MKETTIGGIFMPRKYTHLEKYEKEILELKAKGLTRKEIGEKLNLTRQTGYSKIQASPNTIMLVTQLQVSQ
jgi:DNA-binding CsgD family transcriptional regulator